MMVSSSIGPPPPIIHAVSGSLGGSIALFLLYPLERARIEFQRNASAVGTTDAVLPTYRDDHSPYPESFELVEETKVGDDAIFDTMTNSKHNAGSQDLSLIKCIQELWMSNALYRGVAHNSVSLAISNFCFFFVNEFVKQFLEQRSVQGVTRGKLRPEQYLLASCIAGACNVLITNPLWVTNLHIVTDDHGDDTMRTSPGIVQGLVQTARTHGIAHLWSGTAVSLLLVSNPVIQFFVYEQLKLSFRWSKNSPVRIFLMAAVAKLIATVLTYPLQLSQTALRLEENNQDDDSGKKKNKLSILSCLQSIYKRGGAKALFTGMRPKLLQTVLSAAFTFLTYEQIAAALHGGIVKQSGNRRRTR